MFFQDANILVNDIFFPIFLNFFFILVNEDRVWNKISNFDLYMLIRIKINYKILKILYSYLFCHYAKKLGWVIKMCFGYGHDLVEDSKIGKENDDKNNIYL